MGGLVVEHQEVDAIRLHMMINAEDKLATVMSREKRLTRHLGRAFLPVTATIKAALRYLVQDSSAAGHLLDVDIRLDFPSSGSPR